MHAASGMDMPYVGQPCHNSTYVTDPVADCPEWVCFDIQQGTCNTNNLDFLQPEVATLSRNWCMAGLVCLSNSVVESASHARYTVLLVLTGSVTTVTTAFMNSCTENVEIVQSLLCQHQHKQACCTAQCTQTASTLGGYLMAS